MSELLPKPEDAEAGASEKLEQIRAILKGIVAKNEQIEIKDPENPEPDFERMEKAMVIVDGQPLEVIPLSIDATHFEFSYGNGVYPVELGRISEVTVLERPPVAVDTDALEAEQGIADKAEAAQVTAELEKAFEVPTREQVLAAIEKVSGIRQEPTRELYDKETGALYLLYTETTDEAGDIVEYSYVLKGDFANNVTSTETVIHVAYHSGGIPCGGKEVASFNETSGIWDYKA